MDLYFFYSPNITAAIVSIIKACLLRKVLTFNPLLDEDVCFRRHLVPTDSCGTTSGMSHSGFVSFIVGYQTGQIRRRKVDRDFTVVWRDNQSARRSKVIPQCLLTCNIDFPARQKLAEFRTQKTQFFIVIFFTQINK